MLKLPNSIEPAVMAENIVHLRDAEASLDGRVSDLEVTAPKDYSTKETATGQKWIDGKDIYSITYTGTFITLTQLTGVIVATGLNNYTLIDVCGYALTSAGSIVPCNCYIGGTVAVSLNVFLQSDGRLVASVTSGFSECDYAITIFYTKPDPVPGDAKGPEEPEPEEPEEKKTTKKKTTK